MKKQRFNLFGIVIMLICALVGIVDGSAMGVMSAEAAVTEGGAAGVVVTRDGLTTDITRVESPDLILDTVDQRITKMRPASTPLDQIMRHATSKTSDTMEFGYYSTDIRPVKAVLANAYTAVTTTDSAELTVDNGDLFDVSDTIYVPSVKGYNAAGVLSNSSLVLYVRAVGASNVITVQAVNGGAGTGGASGKLYVPSIGAGAVFYRMGRAAAEGDVQTSPYSALPTKEKNYCQIFKCQVAQTSIQALSSKEVPWNPSDIEEQAVYEWRLGMEASFLFGEKQYFYDSLKKRYVYTTGGIVNNISKVIEYPDKIETVDLIDITKTVFTGNSGSKRRLLFAGSGLVSKLSSVGTIEKQLEAGNTVVVWGIEWKEIKTNFGTLLLLQHDLLDLYGWENKGLIIDPACLDKYTFKGVERFTLDLKKAGTYDGDVAVITEIAGLALRYKSVHAILEPGAAVVEVTGITTSAATASKVVAATYDWGATLTIAPAGATNKALTFASSDPTKATIDEEGVVTALAAGTTVLSAKTADGNYAVVCVLTVTAE